MSQLKTDLEIFNKIALSLLADEKTNPMAERIPVEQLYSKLNLTLAEDPISEVEIEKTLHEIALATPKTASKSFFNQLFGGRQGKAVLGDLLAVLLNNSMYTYKVAGPQVGIEKEVINQIIDLIGYNSDSGGTFPTGGSMSNYMAMLMARDVADEHFKEIGASHKLIAYTSIESHYSNAKNAAFSGIGRKNVRYIAADSKGRMLASKLELQIIEDIENGYKPFFINATAGTTVLGAFDPFEEIANISKKYNIWFHIDGAYCGGVIFSKDHKRLHYWHSM